MHDGRVTPGKKSEEEAHISVKKHGEVNVRLLGLPPFYSSDSVWDYIHGKVLPTFKRGLSSLVILLEMFSHILRSVSAM